MDSGQRQVSGKTGSGSGYRLKLLAALTLVVSAAGYIAYEPASISLDSLIGMLSDSGCNQDQESCTSVAANADGQQGSGDHRFAHDAAEKPDGQGKGAGEIPEDMHGKHQR